jgi:indole-3-glycerol phosphate synthase
MDQIPDILAKIRAAKRVELAELSDGARCAFEKAAAQQAPPRGFRAALTATERVALIAEVKKASPSAGLIRADFDPVALACAYQRGGAAAVSVLTDRQFFQGDPAFLSRIREAVAVPLLRKDFILDEVQVMESRALGADACLLIVAALQPDRLQTLMDAVRTLGMDALVEVHDEHEMSVALDAGADLIGINNRDLRTFKVSLETTERLAPLVPDGVVLVAESGIRTRADVERLKAGGIAAVLVGETLMRAEDVEAATRALVGV